MKARYAIRVKLFEWNPWSTPKFPYLAEEKEELFEHVSLLKRIYDKVGIEDLETGAIMEEAECHLT